MNERVSYVPFNALLGYIGTATSEGMYERVSYVPFNALLGYIGTVWDEMKMI